MSDTKTAVSRIVRASRTARSLEDELPKDIPQTIIEAGADGKRPQTVWVKLKTDYWPFVPLTDTVTPDGTVKKSKRGLAGSTIELPYDEAQRLTGSGKAEVGMPPRADA